MSDEVQARQKYNCPACGAEAQWNAAKQALVCPYCGTVSPATMDAAGNIAEHDLATALRAIGPEDRGWATEKKSVKCQSCQAITVFDPSRAAQRCDFCGSAAIIPVDQQARPIRPDSLLEFKLPETQVREAIRKWYGSRWFAPNKLGTRALTDTVHGIYIPYWTFDAQVSADWTAMSGNYYYETESYTDSQGKRQTRQVRKTRWYPSSGHLDHFFDDELVPATKGVETKLLRGVEPFPTTSDLKPYDPGFLSGWVVEQYQIDLVAAARARTESHGGKDAAALREAGAGRHAPRPECGRRFFRADLQAHPRPRVAAGLHVWQQKLPGGDQRLHRRHQRAGIRRVRSKSSCSCCSSSRSSEASFSWCNRPA